MAMVTKRRSWIALNVKLSATVEGATREAWGWPLPALGRQQQLKDEEERRKKHQQEEDARKKAEQEAADKADQLDAVEGKQHETSSRPSNPAPFADPPHPDRVGISRTPRSVLNSKRDDKKDKEIDWDKLAETYKDAADSADACQKSCQQIDNCLQWRYKAKGDGECHLGKVLRLGRKTNDGDEPWSSGWILDRIENTEKQWECKQVKWSFYQ